MNIEHTMSHFARLKTDDGMVLNLIEERGQLKIMLIHPTSRSLAVIGGASNVIILREVEQ